MNTYKLFCYGTLKEGFYNHDYFLSKSTKIKSATLKGFEMWQKRGLPFVKKSLDSTKEIHGEIYEIDLETLKQIDVLEGHPNFYTRIFVDQHEGVLVYIYDLQDDEMIFVESGDFTGRLN